MSQGANKEQWSQQGAPAMKQAFYKQGSQQGAMEPVRSPESQQGAGSQQGAREAVMSQRASNEPGTP